MEDGWLTVVRRCLERVTADGKLCLLFSMENVGAQENERDLCFADTDGNRICLRQSL